MLKMFSHRWARMKTDFRTRSASAVGYAECRRPDGKRERSDALSVWIRDNPWENNKKT